MNDRAKTYLNRALALDPSNSAAELLRLRREYFQVDDMIVAEADEDGTDVRTRLQHRLHQVRWDFWRLNETDLISRLETLATVANAETAVTARRLLQVARQRTALAKLWSDERAHASFVAALLEILVAPNNVANLRREREHSWMRPEQNPQHQAARAAIQHTIRHIEFHYPGVFALEETWLSELAAYNPEAETENTSVNALFGIGVLGFSAATLAVAVGLVAWIFS